MVRRKLSFLGGTNVEHVFMFLVYHLEEENAQEGSSAAVSCCCLHSVFKIRSTAKWLITEGHEPRPHP